MGAAGELKVRGNAFMSNFSTPAGSGSLPDSQLSAQKKSRPALKTRKTSIADQSSESSGSEDGEESHSLRDRSLSPRNSSFNSKLHSTTTAREHTGILDSNQDGSEGQTLSLASIEEGSEDDFELHPVSPSSADKSKRFVKRSFASSSGDRRYVSRGYFSRNRPSNLQQQLGSLPNASLQSLISSLTHSSGSSGNSTVTQGSYDKLAVRRRRPAKRRRAPKDTVQDKHVSRPLKGKPETRNEVTHGRKTKTILSTTMEEDDQVRPDMSRPTSRTSRASRKDSILSPPTPSSRRPSTSSSRSRSRNGLNGQWKRQETFNSDSGISVTSSPDARMPPKVPQDERTDHDDAASDSSDEASSSDDDSPRELVPTLRAPSATDVSTLPPSRALPDADPLVQRLQDQEAAMQHHILHSPQPKRTIRPQVSSSYHPSPALPLYDRHATSAVPSNHPFSPPAPNVPHGDPMYFQSYYEPNDQHLRAPDPRFQLDMQRTTIAGYEMLAEKLSHRSEKDISSVTPLYRKFEQLNHRVLLHLQDEISELEEELRVLDEMIAQVSSLPDEAAHPASRRTEARYGSELHFQRTQVLGKIFLKLQQYNQGLASYSDAKSKYAPAVQQDVSIYRAWMNDHAPIDPRESRYLEHDDDLVSPGKRPSTSQTTHPFDLKHLMTLHCVMMVLLLLAFSIIPGLLAKILFGAVLLCSLGAATWLPHETSIARSKKDA